MPKLTLYHFAGCPYCEKVKDYLSKRKISIPMKDTRADPADKEELIRIGGRSQVPCLVIDGRALYESNDIIQWFKNNYAR
jgi:glutaredoxin